MRFATVKGQRRHGGRWTPHQPSGSRGPVTFAFPDARHGTVTAIDYGPSHAWNEIARGSGVTVAPGIHGMWAWRGDGSTNTWLRIRDVSGTPPAVPLIGDGLAAGQFTFACWAKFNSFSAQHELYGESSGVGATSFGGACDVLTTGKVRNLYYNGGYVALESNATLSTDIWYHIAWTRGAGGRAIFVNGVLDTSNSDTATPSTGGGAFLFSGWNGSASSGYVSLNGDACGIVAYDKDMGAGFIRRLYQRPLSFLPSGPRWISPGSADLGQPNFGFGHPSF